MNCVVATYIAHTKQKHDKFVYITNTHTHTHIDVQITNKFEHDIIKLLLMLYHYLLCCLNSIYGMLDVFDETVPWYLGWRQCQTQASKKSIIDCGTSPLPEKEW